MSVTPAYRLFMSAISIDPVDNSCLCLERQPPQRPRSNDRLGGSVPARGPMTASLPLGFRSQINANSSGKYDEIKSSGTRCVDCHPHKTNKRPVDDVIWRLHGLIGQRPARQLVIFSAALACVRM